MKHNPEEFIGGELKVTSAKNKSLIGLSGKIIKETKKTFTITNNKHEDKTILKNGCKFIINGREVDGKDVEARPEERIKQRR